MEYANFLIFFIRWNTLRHVCVMHFNIYLSTLHKCSVNKGNANILAIDMLKVHNLKGCAYDEVFTCYLLFAGLALPSGCADKPWLANCVLIVQARLCRHPYFSDFCCKSCHQAGLLP